MEFSNILVTKWRNDSGAWVLSLPDREETHDP